MDIAILADHYITAAEVFEVIGKGTDGADDRVRIPSSLVLDALTLGGALAQQVIEVDGKFGTHAGASLEHLDLMKFKIGLKG